MRCVGFCGGFFVLFFSSPPVTNFQIYILLCILSKMPKENGTSV
jgi:hypothetical protein